MKNIRTILILTILTICLGTDAQIRYLPNGVLTFGNTEPYEFYNMTFSVTGAYFKCKTNNFFQIDLTPAVTRLAGHGNQIAFYNTKTSAFNSIQVKNVYNYSDARAKSRVQDFNIGLDLVGKLRPVTYSFVEDPSISTFTTAGDNIEIGLIAQEVEKVIPNAVITDTDGNKLINYTAIITVLIDAVQTLEKQVQELKSTK